MKLLLFFTERVTNQELPKLAQNAAKRPHQQNGALRAPFLPAFFGAYFFDQVGQPDNWKGKPVDDLHYFG